IGGPALVRAAAKILRDGLIVVDPRRYPDVLHELDRPSGPSLEFRLALAQDAIAYTGQYDTAIASALARFSIDRGQFVRSDSGSSAGSAGRIDLSLEKIRDLRYGENPHQRAAWYQIAQNGARGSISILQGKELSYTNLLDLDAAARGRRCPACAGAIDEHGRHRRRLRSARRCAPLTPHGGDALHACQRCRPDARSRARRVSALEPIVAARRASRRDEATPGRWGM